MVDGTTARRSLEENGDGYVLTAGLLRWFWDHYAKPADRGDPRASPLHGTLAELPPACIVTAEFDPLRDEGVAYAAALEAAGVPVRHLSARGHIHTSVTMVDVVISGAGVRAQMAEALREFFPSTVPASARRASGATLWGAAASSLPLGDDRAGADVAPPGFATSSRMRE